MKFLLCLGIMLAFVTERALTQQYLLGKLPIQSEGRNFGGLLDQNSVLNRLSSLETAVTPLTSGSAALQNQFANLQSQVSPLQSLPSQVATLNTNLAATNTKLAADETTIAAANATANAAKAAADAATTSANAAKADAAAANATANTAKTSADAATTSANAAKADAATANATANTAKTTADTAKTTADTAKTTADTAKSTADTAKTTADTAKTTADTAKTTADTAKTTADAAKIAADAAKLAADALPKCPAAAAADPIGAKMVNGICLSIGGSDTATPTTLVDYDTAKAACVTNKGTLAEPSPSDVNFWTNLNAVFPDKVTGLSTNGMYVAATSGAAAAYTYLSGTPIGNGAPVWVGTPITPVASTAAYVKATAATSRTWLNPGTTANALTATRGYICQY